MSCLSVLLTELIGPVNEMVTLWHTSCSLVLSSTHLGVRVMPALALLPHVPDVPFCLCL